MGKRVNPIFIRKIYNREGDLIKEKKPESSRVLSEQTSYIMLQMMKDVYEPGGTAGFLRSSYNLKGIVAGKSGTTNESADLWLTAMTPDQVITSWVGFDYKTTLGEDEYGSKAHGKGFAYILNELWKKKLNKIKDKIYKNKNKEEIDLDDLNITRHDLKKRYIIEKDEKNENNPYDQNETAGNDGGNDENISSGKESKKKKETVLIDWERPPGLIRMLVNPWNGKIVDSTLDEKKEEEVIDEKLEAEEKEDSEDKRNKKDGVIMYFYKGTEPTHYVEDEKEKEEVDFSDF
jgi:membrane peptidoglycan carboxypeptidase